MKEQRQAIQRFFFFRIKFVLNVNLGTGRSMPFKLPKRLVPYFIFSHLIFFFNTFYLFYFWLCWVFVATRGLFSGCSEQGLLFVAVHELLIVLPSLVVEHGL